MDSDLTPSEDTAPVYDAESRDVLAGRIIDFLFGKSTGSHLIDALDTAAKNPDQALNSFAKQMKFDLVHGSRFDALDHHEWEELIRSVAFLRSDLVLVDEAESKPSEDNQSFAAALILLGTIFLVVWLSVRVGPQIVFYSGLTIGCLRWVFLRVRSKINFRRMTRQISQNPTENKFFEPFESEEQWVENRHLISDIQFPTFREFPAMDMNNAHDASKPTFNTRRLACVTFIIFVIVGPFAWIPLFKDDAFPLKQERLIPFPQNKNFESELFNEQ